MKEKKRTWLLPMSIGFALLVIGLFQALWIQRIEQVVQVSEWYELDEQADWETIFEPLNHDLQEAVFTLHYEVFSQRAPETFDPFVEMMDVAAPHPLDSPDAEAFIESSAHEQFDVRLANASNRLNELNAIHGVAYLAIYDSDVTSIVSSGHRGIEGLFDDQGLDMSQLWDLELDFAHVIVVRYNSQGRWEIPLLVAPEMWNLINEHLAFFDDGRLSLLNGGNLPGTTALNYRFENDLSESNGVRWRAPRNMTFVFGIPYPMIEVLHAPQYTLRSTTHYHWNVPISLNQMQSMLLGLVVAFAFFLPLKTFKKRDRGYEKLRALPVEAIVFLCVLFWNLTLNQRRYVVSAIRNAGWIDFRTGSLFSDQNVGMVIYLALLFVTLCLIGYGVCYVKDLYAQKGQTLKADSLIVNLLSVLLAGDLKKSQDVQLAIVIYGQILVGIGLFFLSDLVFRRANLINVPMLIFLYLTVLYLFARHKAAKIRADYLKLFGITQELASGNLELEAPENLGHFETLKAELMTIQEGMHRATKNAVANERMKGELITNVSHDLKTPLTSIVKYVDLLQVEDLDEEKRQQYLATLASKTDRLKTLIEDLFEVSKATTGNVVLEKMEVDVITLIRQTLLGLEDRIAASNITVKENYPEEPVRLTLDGARMHRVFENLIVNIVKYALPQTRAYIDVVDEQTRVHIVLRNISMHELSHDMNDLAERFVRGDAARNTEGSGLGLAIAKSFVELQGGTFIISVDGDLFKVTMTFEK